MNIKGTIRYRVALKSALFPPDTHTHTLSLHIMTIQEANTQMDGTSKANTDTQNRPFADHIRTEKPWNSIAFCNVYSRVLCMTVPWSSAEWSWNIYPSVNW